MRGPSPPRRATGSAPRGSEGSRSCGANRRVRRSTPARPPVAGDFPVEPGGDGGRVPHTVAPVAPMQEPARP
jgi:hypothetical protein